MRTIVLEPVTRCSERKRVIAKELSRTRETQIKYLKPASRIYVMSRMIKKTCAVIGTFTRVG